MFIKMMEAIRQFDTEQGFRFLIDTMWWIRA
jgi:DNA-directed RNA polymerase sigma subunit (sigma70/sigma32)